MSSFTPFFEVVSSTLKRNEKWCWIGISSIAQIILFVWNAEVLGLCMLKNAAVSSTPFPSRENVDKLEVEVACCKDILQQLALVIAICGSLSLRDIHRYMHPIQSTNTPFKVAGELWWMKDFDWDRIVTSWEPHLQYICSDIRIQRVW